MMSEEEQKRLELQEIRRKTDAVTNESLESTRRILQIAEQTQDTGISTAIELEKQSEQLGRIEETLHVIKQDVKEADKSLNALEKFCGLCLCRCRRNRFEDSVAYKKAYEKSKNHPNNNTNSAEKMKETKNSKNTTNHSTGGYIQKVTNDAREEEMDENLGKVAGIVDNLKHLAIDMGNTLDKDNDKILKITDIVIVEENNIEIANKRAEKILRN